METITLKRAIEIIKIHGNLDEIFYFFKECGHKSNYKLKDLKDWLGYYSFSKSSLLPTMTKLHSSFA